VKIVLQLHPTRITDAMLESDILPVLRGLGCTWQILPRLHGSDVEVDPDAELILVLGGDGTFLAGARLAVRLGVPILGVMVGRLSFLCSVTLDNLGPALRDLMDGKMLLEERCVLHGRIESDGVVTHEEIAVNDIVVFRSQTDRIRDFTATHGGRPIATYRADGIILSTATGSTAYTLAAGGPLVHPTLDLLVLTPICAHSLFTKPLILPPKDEVAVQASPASYPLDVTFDGAARVTMQHGDRLVIQADPDSLRVYRPAEHDFYNVLRLKFQHGYIYGGDHA
jgi:NAD+ kinase